MTDSSTPTIGISILGGIVMIYKLANVSDLAMLPPIDKPTMDVLYQYTNILETEYGSNRDVDNGYGGYVLYCTSGTKVDEIKAMFDFEKYVIEFVEHTYEANPQICTIVYITSCERGVVLVMSIGDLPKEITNTF